MPPGTTALPLAAFLAYALLYIAWILSSWGQPETRTVVGDLAPLPLEIAAVLLAVAASSQSAAPRRVRLAWRWLALALGAFALGDATWFVSEVVLGQSPFPSLSDVFYLAYYPLALVGLLIFPGPYRDRREFVGFLLDTAIVLVAGVSCIWYLVIGPTAAEGGADSLAVALALAYPVLDLVLLCGILAAAFGRTDVRSHRALVLLLVALLTGIVSDVAYALVSLHGDYGTGNAVDAGFAIQFCLAGLAAWFQMRDAARVTDRAEPAREPELTPVWPRSRIRPVVLGGATLVAPLIVTLQVAGGDTSGVSLAIAAWVLTVVLVVVRVVGLVDEVRAGDAQLRLVAAHARDVLYRLRVSPDQRFEYLSPALTAMTGYTPEEFYASPSLGIGRIHPDDLAGLTALAGGPPGPRDPGRLRWVRRDGSVLWVEHSSVLVRQPDGSQVVEGVIRDVTAQMLAEDALRESEERLRSVLTGAPIVLLSVDRDETVALVEGQRARDFGADRERAIGARLADVFPAQPSLVAAMRRALAGEAVVDAYQVGEAVFEGRMAPLRPGDGAVTGALFVATDVTQRTRAEHERDLLGAVVEQASESILVTDERGKTVYVNPALSALTGYAADEVLGHRPEILVHEDERRRLRSGLIGAARTGAPWTMQCAILCRDGTKRVIELVVTPVRDENATLTNFVAMGRDVTHERELEAQLEHAQKMEAVGRLAGGLAHDFNNLLTAVSGYAALLEDSLAGDADRLADVHEIQRAAERATSLTSQLLAFGRRQVLRPQALDLGHVIGEVGRMLERLLGEDVSLVTDIAPDLGTVMADPGQIEQVLLNLAVNARDAMPGGGRLVIAAANVDLVEEGSSEPPGALTGPCVRLTVSDTGVGIAPDTQPRIFEPFFTTKELGKGTGLGLATAYGVVTQSGGRITVASTPGEGSTFTILLPRVEGNVRASSQDGVIPGPATGGRERILVVEDDEAVRSLIVGTLGRQGYRVTAAADGRDALRRLDADASPIALLVTDVVMPELSGPHVARAVLERHPDARVLYVSGYPRQELGEGNAIGPDVEFLQKPFSPVELVARVRTILDQGRPSRRRS